MVNDWMAEKTLELAKELEFGGWEYPKHLSGRAFGLFVHGDDVGTDVLRRSLTDWLLNRDLVQAGNVATVDRYIGYYERYATTHQALDEDGPFGRRLRMLPSCL